MASNLDESHIAQQVYELLGYCPIQNRIKPGLLAEGTLAQIRVRLVEMLKANGVDEAEASRVSAFDLGMHVTDR